MARTVNVKAGHLSGSPRPYKVAAGTTVGELLKTAGFKVEDEDKILSSPNWDEVDSDDKVKAGTEYVVSSNLKAR